MESEVCVERSIFEHLLDGYWKKYCTSVGINSKIGNYIIFFWNETQPLYPPSLLLGSCSQRSCCILSHSSTRTAGCKIQSTEVSQPLNPCDKGSLCLVNAWPAWVNPLLIGRWKWADRCQEFTRAGLIDGGIAAKMLLIWKNKFFTLFSYTRLLCV